MSDFGSTGGDVYLVDAQTGAVARPYRGRSVSRSSRCDGTTPAASMSSRTFLERCV